MAATQTALFNPIWAALTEVNRTGPQGPGTPFDGYVDGVAQALIRLTYNPSRILLSEPPEPCCDQPHCYQDHGAPGAVTYDDCALCDTV